jgi:hypothetical protein
MATNAGIVTGKQFIRFAETLEADTNEVYEFRPVFNQGATTYLYGSTIVGTDAVGISQYFVEALANAPTDSRLLSVATSGLLLVEADSAVASTIAVNSKLTVDATGRANTAGTAITIGGRTPVVREVLVGQRSFVLVAV